MSATVTLPTALTCPFCGAAVALQISAPVLALAVEVACAGCQQRWAGVLDQRGVWTTPAAGTRRGSGAAGSSFRNCGS